MTVYHVSATAAFELGPLPIEADSEEAARKKIMAAIRAQEDMEFTGHADIDLWEDEAEDETVPKRRHD